MRACQFRLAALAAGEVRYSTGKPCRSGHVSERLTSNGDCLACGAARGRRYRLEDPEKKRRVNARYYRENTELVRQINAAWGAKNDERRKAVRRTHYHRNKGDYNSRARARQDHIEIATPSWVDMKTVRAFYREAARLTRETGIPHEVDHIHPLRGKTSCGLHVPWNLQVMPAAANRSKSNRLDCGEAHDRDLNAARNILRIGLERQTPMRGALAA